MCDMLRGRGGAITVEAVTVEKEDEAAKHGEPAP